MRAHPLALLHPENVSDPKARAELARLTSHYPDGEHFFVERLSEGIGTIAAAFWPKAGGVSNAGLQIDRVREPVGRQRLRANGEQPNDRLSWCVALRAPGL